MPPGSTRAADPMMGEDTVPAVVTALIILNSYDHAIAGVGTYSMIAFSGSRLIPTMYDPPFSIGP